MQFDQWTRRAFITLFGGAAVYWPVVANAETRNRPLIAWLGGSTPELGARNLDALRKGLEPHYHFGCGGRAAMNHHEYEKRHGSGAVMGFTAP